MFNGFFEKLNCERHQEALNMKTPGKFYKPSDRIYRGLSEVKYPKHEKTITLTSSTLD
jgi:hypothetical protein